MYQPEFIAMGHHNRIENVKLSFICHQNYEQMSPCERGRYCISCNKTVIDFTNQDMDALVEALETSEKVCGRFTRKQVTIKHKSVFNFKHMAASLFLTLGFSLY